MWKGRCKSVKLFIQEAHVLVLNSRFSALSVWLSCLELVWVSGGYIIIMDFLGWWVEAIFGYPECHTWDDSIPIIPEFPESFLRQTGCPLCRAYWAVSLRGWRGCELLSNCANRFLISQPHVISRTCVSALHKVQTRVSVFIFVASVISFSPGGEKEPMWCTFCSRTCPCLAFGGFDHISLWLLTSHALFVSVLGSVCKGRRLLLETTLVFAAHSLLPFWIRESGGKRLHHDFERKVVDS